MKEVRDIEAHMQPVILEQYPAFLNADRFDPHLRQYPDYADEVRANLAHADYRLAADIAYSRDFDAEASGDQPNFEKIQLLHAALLGAFPDELEETA